MKTAKKPVATKSNKGISKTQINTTLQDSTEIIPIPSQQSVAPATVHTNKINLGKKPNYFNLKLQTNLSSTPLAAKVNVHQRHYSVSQTSTKINTNPATPLTAYDLYSSFTFFILLSTNKYDIYTMLETHQDFRRMRRKVLPQKLQTYIFAIRCRKRTSQPPTHLLKNEKLS